MIDFALSPELFRSRYFERDIHLQRGAVHARPFDWAALDELLHHIEPTPAMVQMFRDGLVPQDVYSEDTIELGTPRRRLNKSRFYSQLQNGATLVINKLERYSTAAKHACMEIGRFVEQQTTSNAYLSLGGSGTFGKHWDTHDVFAIQFIGRKRWQVFKPTFPLPLARHKSAQVAAPPEAEPVLDCVLEPGDMLYVPRGWWHQVFPLDEASFHLSVGVYVPTVFDYAMWLCNRALPDQLAARKGFGGSADPMTDFAAVLQTFAEHLRSPVPLQAFLRELAENERTSSDFNLSLMMNKEQSSDEHMLVRPTSFRPPSSTGEVIVNGATLRLDRISQEILARVWEAGVISLPHLCEQLRHASRDSVRTRVLELAKQDVLSVSGAD